MLDLGCGFGRQAYLLAMDGYKLTGVDSSPVFIDIAKRIFYDHSLPGIFICDDITRPSLTEKYVQILLLDVLEHIDPEKRRNFIQQLYSLTANRGKVLVSLPHVKKRFTSMINNRIRKRITQYVPLISGKEEHPYPIPEKKDIERLFNSTFNILAIESAADTDYYLLQKI